MSPLSDLWADYTLRQIALGCAILGLVSGVLGSYAVLRKQGLLGDTLAHCALPGVVLAFLATGSKAPVVLMMGAALSGWLGTAALAGIRRWTRADPGTGLALVLASFFGLGVVLLSVVQKRPDAGQAGLDKFLFGQAAALTSGHVLTMAVAGCSALAILALFAKELKLATFDPEFAGSLGLPRVGLDLAFTGLLVVAVVIGLNAVGVVLMAALLVTPAAAARQWTDRLTTMVLLSGAIGALSGVIGAWISASAPQIPTGPVVVLFATLVFALSIAFGSKRGLVWRLRRPA